MKRRRRLWMITAAVCLLAVPALLVMQREKTLLEKATRIAQVKSYPYVWLSDHEVLLMMGGNYHWRIARLDTRNRTWIREKRLDAVLNAFNTDQFIYPSPDGKWLLCSAFDGEPDAHAVRLSDGKTLRWNVEGDTDYLWLPGSIRWIALEGVTSVNGDDSFLRRGLLFSLNSARLVKSLPASSNIRYSSWTEIQPIGGRLQVPDEIKNKDYNTIALQSTECEIESERIVAKRTNRLSLSHPIMEGSLEYAYSPHGDRVVWVERFEVKPTLWQRWLGRWLPRFQNTGRRMTLNVARLDGTQRQLLGSLTVREEDIGIDSLRWLPDGRQVSFMAQGALWTMPVEGTGE